MSNRVLTEKELASELGLSPWTVRTLRLQQGLPHFRTAGRIFYRLESVQQWISQQETCASGVTNVESEDYGVLRRVR